jgi:hypothetical protein
LEALGVLSKSNAERLRSETDRFLRENAVGDYL